LADYHTHHHPDIRQRLQKQRMLLQEQRLLLLILIFVKKNISKTKKPGA